MGPTQSGTYVTWEAAECTMRGYLSRICPRLQPSEVAPETYQAGALRRARETYDQIKNATIGRSAEEISWVFWYFAVWTALDERRWLVGRGKYATAELEMYISIHLMQPWNLKSDIEKAMLHHAKQSDEGLRSCKSIKLLFWNRYSEEQICRFWYDDYDIEHRNEIKRLVREDTDELRSVLKELHIPLIKKPKGEGYAYEEAREVLEDIHGE